LSKGILGLRFASVLLRFGVGGFIERFFVWDYSTMPALVNYGGDDDFYSGGSFYTNSTDLGRLCSISSQVDVYYPPRKRARITAPFVVGETLFEQSKQASIDVLPDECLFEIFKRLPGGRERSSCACVSKHWLMLLISIRKGEYESSKAVKENTDSVSDEDDGYLTRCLEGKKATDMRLAAVAVGTSGHGGLGKLSIRGSSSSSGVTNFGLSAIARGCPSLKALSLWNVPRVGDEGLSEIAKECHLLEKLDLCQCPSFSNKDFSLAVIGHYGKSVTNLMLSGLENVSEKGFWVMGNAQGLQKLVSLTITSCRGVTDVSLEAMGKGCANLRQMCLRRCCFISDDGLVAFAKSAGSLESLQLEECNRITQSGTIGVLSNCSLKSLTVVKCMGIKDISSEVPLSCCNSLKSLS
ncbi:hypothetical protein Goarm_012186, partial [Gossypium armourianum]|nr:hypothetical protein [Gossypium armourianum]